MADKYTISSLFKFIKKSTGPFHAVDEVKNILTENGYTELWESSEWKLEAGREYFVTRNLSSVIAFRIPAEGFNGFMMTASHSDSPSFKIKEQAEMNSKPYVRLNTERYGGMLCATWLDRPLHIAGKIMVKEDDRIRSLLYSSEEPMVLIPNVAIHMNRAANTGFEYKANVDMVPLWGSGDCGTLRKKIADEVNISAEDIISTDLFLINNDNGVQWGSNGEFISCPRLDDLECVYGSLQGFLAANETDTVPVLAVLDNEEVGSTTKQGADSTFLDDVLSRICESFGFTQGKKLSVLANSFLVSADNAHAVHPNHPEYSDPTSKVYINGGVVIKYNANQKYTTDSVSDALFTRICGEAGVPVQRYTNRADMMGGSTLGNISATHVSVNTVDIGIAQLAMHSSFETAGSEDITHMINALTAFYSARIRRLGYGEYILK